MPISRSATEDEYEDARVEKAEDEFVRVYGEDALEEHYAELRGE